MFITPEWIINDLISRRGRPRPQPLLAPAIHYSLTNVQMCGRQAGRALRSPVEQRPRDSLISKVYKNTESLASGLVIELLEYFLTVQKVMLSLDLKSIHTSFRCLVHSTEGVPDVPFRSLGPHGLFCGAFWDKCQFYRLPLQVTGKQFSMRFQPGGNPGTFVTI